MFLLVLSLVFLLQCSRSLGVLTCCGNEFCKTISVGGQRRDANITSLPCSSCTGVDTLRLEEKTFVLGSTALYGFINGTTADILPLDKNCTPEKIVLSHASIRRLHVKCLSSSPDYNPQYQSFHQPEGKWKSLSFTTLTLGGRTSYANRNDNSVIVGANYEDYIVSLRRNVPELLIQLDSRKTDPAIPVPLDELCDTILTLQGAPPFLGEDGEQPQVIIDCTKSGQQLQWILTVDTIFFELDIQNTKRLQNTNGHLIESRNPNILAFITSSQLTVIDRQSVETLPAIENFSDVINNAEFLTDELVLIESNGHIQQVLNITQFVSSESDSGLFSLLNSSAYCPDGRCAAHAILDHQHLVSFRRSSANYLEARSYDLFNLHQPPQVVGKILIRDFPHVCTFSEDELPQTTTTLPYTSTAVDTSNNYIIIISVPLTIIAGTVIILVVGVACCISCTMSYSKCKDMNNKQPPTQEYQLELNKKSELVVSSISKEEPSGYYSDSSNPSSIRQSRTPSPTLHHDHVTQPQIVEPVIEQTGHQAGPYKSSIVTMS